MRGIGVDYIKYSYPLVPGGAVHLSDGEFRSVQEQIGMLSFADRKPEVISDTMERRNGAVFHTAQDYDYCGTKDLLCVVEGSGAVYTCCIKAGGNDGRLGDLIVDDFPKIWRLSSEYKMRHRPCEDCLVQCIYRERNLRMLELRNVPEHVNFI
jgi:hypothetical protein